MDHQRFDALIRKLGATPRSRRGALRLVTGGALAGLLAHAGIGVPAAAAGCLTVAKPCRRASQCCSGICRRSRGKKTCRGHHAGTCKRDQNFCTAASADLTKCNNNANCYCFQTTAGTSYCAEGTVGECADCERDADCVALGFPVGSACTRVGAGRCIGACASDRLCAVPCGFAPPLAGQAGDDTVPLGPLGGNR